MTVPLRKLFLLNIVLLLPCSNSWASARKHNVNCNKQFEFSRTQLTLSADYMKKITGSLSLTPQLMGQVDKWTEISLDNQRALCDAYSKSTEAEFSTGDYLKQLEGLRSWQLDFLKIVITAQNVTDKQTAAAAGGKGPNDPEIAQVKGDLNDQVKNLLEHPAKATIPATARK
jgi:hypothetical protein